MSNEHATSISPVNLPPLPQEPSEPALFAPTSLLVLIGLMIGLHTYRVFALGLFEDADIRFLDITAFVPARFTIWAGLVTPEQVISDIRAAVLELRSLKFSLFQTFVAYGTAALWTLVTYAFLHASWEHVIFNCLWMLVFGSPVMKRFGAFRFMLFFVVTAAAAAVFHAAFNQYDVSVLVGASGAVSGLTAAALRFAVGPNGFGASSETWKQPAKPLRVALRDKHVLVFIAVWFGINLLAGLGVPVGGGTDIRVAWEAHVGGFLAGLLLFSFFDPIDLIPPQVRHAE
jgi:membrane associated rhomboid family serine protease